MTIQGMKSTMNIFICLSIFCFIGLMLEYAARQHNEEALQAKMDADRYFFIKGESNHSLEVFELQQKIMPSAFKGQKY